MLCSRGSRGRVFLPDSWECPTLTLLFPVTSLMNELLPAPVTPMTASTEDEFRLSILNLGDQETASLRYGISMAFY